MSMEGCGGSGRDDIHLKHRSGSPFSWMEVIVAEAVGVGDVMNGGGSRCE